MPDLAMPCPYLVGAALCSRPGGHRGRHEPGPAPGLPVISGWRLQRIVRGLLEPAWWRRAPRCPACRTPITEYRPGVPTGPVTVTNPADRGPCARTVNEYPVTFRPCGHQFRRVLPVPRET